VPVALAHAVATGEAASGALALMTHGSGESEAPPVPLPSALAVGTQLALLLADALGEPGAVAVPAPGRAVGGGERVAPSDMGTGFSPQT